MSIISIRLNDNEKEIVKKYAEAKGSNISQLIKDLLFNAIEDEYDLKICQDYLEREAKGNVKLVPFEEAIKEWDL